MVEQIPAQEADQDGSSQLIQDPPIQAHKPANSEKKSGSSKGKIAGSTSAPKVANSNQFLHKDVTLRSG